MGETEEPIAAANVVEGLDHVLKLTVVKMRKILVHYYGENETAMNKLHRSEIESLIRDKMNADPIQPEPTQPNETQTNATPTDPIRTEPTLTDLNGAINDTTQKKNKKEQDKTQNRT